MGPLIKALRSIKRQTELENAMRRPSGIRIAEERELHQLRSDLSQYPASVTLEAASRMRRPVDAILAEEVEPFTISISHCPMDGAGRSQSPWLRNQEQPMHIDALHAPRQSTLLRCVATALLLTLAACSQLSDTRKPTPTPDKHVPRAQLSIGYSLLYQEADGIPKLQWILMFKDKPEEMGRVTHDLVSYYQQLADTLQRLSKQYPGMRIDVAAMSEIEGEVRKAIGTDLAKDFAPLIGKTGVEFEREALLMFYNTLNEQRHLTGVMVGLETDPALRKFLETTKTQLESRYAKVGSLLNRRYFTQ